jgi:hypothetical protein
MILHCEPFPRSVPRDALSKEKGTDRPKSVLLSSPLPDAQRPATATARSCVAWRATASRLGPGPTLVNACCTRLKQSSISGSWNQSRISATVRHTPIEASPVGENAQSRAQTHSVDRAAVTASHSAGAAPAAPGSARRSAARSARARRSRRASRAHVEQAIDPGRPAHVGRDQRLGDQACDAVDDLGRGARGVRGHRAPHLEGEASGEDREAAQHRAFRFGAGTHSSSRAWH